MKISVLYGSTRDYGNTEQLTERVFDGIDVNKIYLNQYFFKDIIDQRHDPEGFDEVDDDYDDIISSIIDSDILVFATPLYWYGMTGVMKRFIDRFSQTARDEKFPDFKERLKEMQVYVIIVGGDSPRKKALPCVQQFGYICDFFGMEFKDALIGEARKPGTIQKDAMALANADNWNRHFKNL
ncbi:flavodoxin family protein [Salimicrobium halophilum]|uniref:Multimeric flavodoxin WrbA n=1 Tax=Salimicrobium halophilum TaxID=86666 RepID=A0A1G8R9A2_9BACI|nr:NAD(P)H-dependent oxidoreductase [Salimicrobium halophilum]SDJ13521.1 Multimeric flavodoxin WrbA [Salimicrobium halophilum]